MIPGSLRGRNAWDAGTAGIDEFEGRRFYASKVFLWGEHFRRERILESDFPWVGSAS